MVRVKRDQGHKNITNNNSKAIFVTKNLDSPKKANIGDQCMEKTIDVKALEEKKLLVEITINGTRRNKDFEVGLRKEDEIFCGDDELHHLPKVFKSFFCKSTKFSTKCRGMKTNKKRSEAKALEKGFISVVEVLKKINGGKASLWKQ